MSKMIFNYIFTPLILLVLIGCGPSDKTEDVSLSNSQTIIETSENTVEKLFSYLMIFNPQKDGFGFKNFRGGEDSSSIKLQDLIDFFGESGICAEGSGSKCVPYPGVTDFLTQLNLVLNNGLCYGFSAMASNLFTDNTNNDKETIFEIIRNNEIDHKIARWHMLQFTKEFRDQIDKSIKKTPLEIVSELQKFLTPNDGKISTPVTLALYSSKGAHSITPIDIEESNSGFTIKVYDSNWPGQLRFVSVSKTGTWTYQGGHENPNDKSDVWEESGTGSMALIPHIIKDKEFECFFCEKSTDNLTGTGSILIFNIESNEGVTLTISDKQGNSIISESNSKNIGIPGAKIYIMPGVAFGHGIKMIYLPPSISEFNVSVENTSKTTKEFSLLHSGNGNPTTTIKGKAKNLVIQGTDVEKLKKKNTSILEIKVTDKGGFQTIVDSESVTEVRQATSLSTTLYKPIKYEKYESNFSNGVINDVEITDVETGEIIASLDQAITITDVPLRSIKNEEGVQFIRSKGHPLQVKFPDGTDISKSSEKSYRVKYADGTEGGFIKDMENNIVGEFTDGSTTIKFNSGESLHTTPEGIIIDEKAKGVYRVFYKKEGSVVEIKSKEELDNILELPKTLGIKLETLTTAKNQNVESENNLERLTYISEQVDLIRNIKKSLAAESSSQITLEKISESILNDIKIPIKISEVDPLIESDPKAKETMIEPEQPTDEASAERAAEPTREETQAVEEETKDPASTERVAEPTREETQTVEEETKDPAPTERAADPTREETQAVEEETRDPAPAERAAAPTREETQAVEERTEDTSPENRNSRSRY